MNSEAPLRFDPEHFEAEVERYRVSAGYRRKIAKRLGLPRGLKNGDDIVHCLQCFGQEWALLCRGAQFSVARMRSAIIYILANT